MLCCCERALCHCGGGDVPEAINRHNTTGPHSDQSVLLMELKHGWIPQNPNASAQVEMDMRPLSSSPVEPKGRHTSRLPSSLFRVTFTLPIDNYTRLQNRSIQMWTRSVNSSW